MLEGYTTLGYLAASTSEVELNLLVRIVNNLDVLFRGRAGHRRRVVRARAPGPGAPFPPLSARFERLEETLELMSIPPTGKRPSDRPRTDGL